VVAIGNGSPKQLDGNLPSPSSRPSVDPWGSIQYRAGRYIDRDYCTIRAAIADKVRHGLSSAKAQALLNSDNIPDMRNGQDPVRFSYRLPGAERQVTSSVEKTISLAEFIE